MIKCLIKYSNGKDSSGEGVKTFVGIKCKFFKVTAECCVDLMTYIQIKLSQLIYSKVVLEIVTFYQCCQCFLKCLHVFVSYLLQKLLTITVFMLLTYAKMENGGTLLLMTSSPVQMPLWALASPRLMVMSFGYLLCKKHGLSSTVVTKEQRLVLLITCFATSQVLLVTHYLMMMTIYGLIFLKLTVKDF